MTKKVKIRWWNGRTYRDPDDVVEVPVDASDEEIETTLFGRQGRMEPVVLAAASMADKASLLISRDARGKLKAGKPPAT